MRVRNTRVLAIASFTSLLAIGGMVGTAAARPGQVEQRRNQIPVQRNFRLTNPLSHGDGGLVILANSLLRSGKTTSIPPDNVFGVKKVEHADLIVQIQLSCDPGFAEPFQPPPERDLIAPTFFVVRGHEGFGSIRVKHNRFRVQGPAFDGSSHQGQLTISGTFSHHGRQVAGSVAVKFPKFTGTPENITGGNGGQFTNCMTDPNLEPTKLGRRLKFLLAA
jgi:hypothetical protein